MGKTIVKLTMLVGILVVSSNTYAIKCSGKILYSYIEKNGSVFVYGNWRNEHTQICSLNSEWKGVSTETCKGWLSITQAAKLADRELTFHYSGSMTSCMEIGSYGDAPSPGYIMQK